MTEQSDKTTSLKQNEIKPATNELSEQDLNSVVGGTGKTAPPKTPPAEPNETVTFEYGSLYVQQR